jgi:hypothetical protein
LRRGNRADWSIGTVRGVHLQSLRPVLTVAGLFNAKIAKGAKFAKTIKAFGRAPVPPGRVTFAPNRATIPSPFTRLPWRKRSACADLPGCATFAALPVP